MSIARPSVPLVLLALALVAAGCAEADDEGEGSLDGELVLGDPANDAVFAVDISHWEGPMSQHEMDCFWTQGVRHVVSGTQVAEITRQQLAMADARGMTIDAYVYLYWHRDPAVQVAEAFATADGFPIGRMWLDVEAPPDGRGASELIGLVRAAVDACHADGRAECGIYTGPGFWRSAMANTSQLAEEPLWYAWYNYQTSLDSWATERFGGWSFPAAKQWAEEALCNVGVDKNSMQLASTPTVVVDRTPPPPPTTVPPAPSGLYPVDGATVRLDYVKLMAASIPHATRWQHALEVWDGGTQSWRTYYTWTSTVPFRKVSPVWTDRYFRLRARAMNGYGWGAWSGWSVFAFGQPTGPAPGAPPPPPPPPTTGDVPTGLAPDGITVTAASVALTWSAVTGATRYEIAVETQAGTGWQIYFTYTSTTAGKTIWPQTHGTSYRFRVRADRGAGYGAWSSFATFGYP
jgi:hypothetical protein